MGSQSYRHRSAFSLIETIVVIGLIVLLGALALMGVQAVRESARKMGCQNSLRQIALAVSAYENVQGCFPLAYGYWVEKSIVPESPYVAIAPHLEIVVQRPRPDMAYGYLRTEPFDRWGKIPFLHCPSDKPLTGSSYRFSTGSGPYPSNRFGATPGGGDGAFNSREHVRASDFSDGLSNTALMSERRKGDGSFGLLSSIVENVRVHSGRDWPTAKEFRQRCAEARRRTTYDLTGRDWIAAGFLFTLYNHANEPNSAVTACTNVSAESSSPGAAMVMGPTSFHRSGVNVAFGDGHIELVSESIDYDVWQSVGARDDQNLARN